MIRALILVTVASLAGMAAAGIPWAASEPLNTNAATDGSVGDYYPQMATDGRGNWVCVWCAANVSLSPRDFEIYVARSADDGLTWTAPEQLDPFSFTPSEIEDDFHPYVVTDNAGHWLTSWYTHDNHGGTLGDDVDILYSRSVDNGVSWTSSDPLNSDAATDQDLYAYAYDSEPQIAFDASSGRWVAVWSRRLTTNVDSDLYVAYSLDNGTTWTAPQLLHDDMLTDDGDDWGATVASDGANRWVIVWSSDNTLGGALGDDGDVFVARSVDGATWTAPQPLNSDAATPGDPDDKSPVVATDGRGRWIVAWYQGIYDVIDDDISYAVSDDNGATWSPQAYLNDNATTDVGRDRRPSIATDGTGRWVAVWYSANTLGLPIGADDDIHYAVSEDNGSTWSSPGVVNSFAADMWDMVYDWNPEIVATDAGRWVVVWYSKYNLNGIGEDWDILFTTACLPVVPGDSGCDGDVDLSDAAVAQRCFAIEQPGDDCRTLDVDGDLDVDFDDIAVQLANFSGPGA